MRKLLPLGFSLFFLHFSTQLWATSPTVLDRGDVMILAISTDLGYCGNFAGQDEISFVCFKDIEPGTTIDFTDNGWEKANANNWGDNEGLIRANRGGMPIPAGTVITFRTTQTGSFYCVAPDNNWSFTSMAGNGVFDLDNAGDQLFLMQNGVWIDPAGADNANYTGKVLYGLNTTTLWQANGSVNQSNPYPFLDCFSAISPVSNAKNLKFSASLNAPTKRQWLERTKNIQNWTDYGVDCNAFHTVGANFSTGLSINGLGGSFAAGKWVGNMGVDWFDCANWDNLDVPTSATNVTVNAVSLNNLNINPSSPLAAQYGNAQCNDLNILNRTVNLFGNYSSLTINGDLAIAASGNLDASNAGTDGKIILKGGANADGSNNFTLGASSLVLSGANQNISGLGTVTMDRLELSDGDKLMTGVDLRITEQLLLSNVNLRLQGSDLHIDNPLPTALLANNSFIVGETGPDNYSAVYWNIGNNIGKYIIPFGTDELEPQSIAFAYDIKSLGIGGSMGEVKFATYPTNAQNQPMPPSVSQLTNDFGKDNYPHVIDRFWVIENSIGSADYTNNYPVIEYTFQYSDNDWADGVNMINENQLAAQRYNADAQTWQDWLYSPTPDPNTNKLSITLGGEQDYKDIWTLSDDSDPLPIELIAFSATCNSGVVNLKWTTASETNNNHFEIERTIDGQTFDKVAEVTGANTSNLIIDYQVADDQPMTKLAYYRLKQVDYDGDYDYSSLVSVEACAEADELSLYDISFRDANIFASAYSDIEQVISVKLYNTQGQLVVDELVKMQKGFNQIKVPVSLSNPGTYFFSLVGQFDMVGEKVFLW